METPYEWKKCAASVIYTPIAHAGFGKAVENEVETNDKLKHVKRASTHSRKHHRWVLLRLFVATLKIASNRRTLLPLALGTPAKQSKSPYGGIIGLDAVRL